MKFNGHKNVVLMEQGYFTGSMPLLTPNHSFRTCGDPKVFNSTKIFMKCGEKLRHVILHVLYIYISLSFIYLLFSASVTFIAFLRHISVCISKQGYYFCNGCSFWILVREFPSIIFSYTSNTPSNRVIDARTMLCDIRCVS